MYWMLEEMGLRRSQMHSPTHRNPQSR